MLLGDNEFDRKGKQIDWSPLFECVKSLKLQDAPPSGLWYASNQLLSADKTSKKAVTHMATLQRFADSLVHPTRLFAKSISA